MFRIARYSSQRSTPSALALTAGVVLLLFVATFVTHLTTTNPQQTSSKEHDTVRIHEVGERTSHHNLIYIFKVKEL